MSWTLTVVVTLITYQVVLVLIGLWARRQNADTADYYLGGRHLGPLVAALSASASSSSAWSLLGVSGAAFAWGLSAIWLIPATLTGFCINWFLIAPRLHRASHDNGALTLTEFLAHGMQPASRMIFMRIAAAIVLFSFTFYIAAQFQAAGKTFTGVLGVSETTAVLVGAGVVMLYVFLGGFWAASITDSLQGILMGLTALLLPVAALSAAGGPANLVALMAQLPDPAWHSWFNHASAIVSLGFVLGLLGIGFGYPGQPHVVNRFMAMRDASAIPRARLIAVLWAVIIYVGMVLLGWCGRVLLEFSGDPEQILFTAARFLLPALLAGVVVSSILSAIMSTADSQLLVAASSVSHDFSGGTANQNAGGLRRARWVVIALGVAAVLLATLTSQSIFNRVLFAWHAVGSAFGPLLIVLLWIGPVRSGYRVAALVTGFTLTVVLHWFPDTPGDIAERYLPLILSLLLSLWGARNAGLRRA